MKKFINVIAIILAIGLFAVLSGNDGAMLPRANQKPVSLITATDLHYLSTALNDNGPAFMKLMENSDGRVSQYVDEITDAFVAEVILAKPDALILSGDLTFNGEMKSHEDLAAKLREVKKAGIEVLLIPGNHDVWNMSSIEFVGDSIGFVQTIKQEQFYSIYEEFGYQSAVSRDEESLSYVYPMRDDLKILMLDANMDMTENVVLTSTVKWLENELKKAKWAGEEVIVVTHQNIISHSKVFTEGYNLINSDQIADILRKYGVQYILGGHIHLQDIQTDDGLTEIVTSALTVSPHQYGYINYDSEGFSYSTRPIDISGWAMKMGITNPDLLNFEEYSKDYFMKNAYESAYKTAFAFNSNEEESKKMAEFYSKINAAYFAGLPIDVAGYDEEIALWRKSKGRLTKYIDSIIDVSNLNRQVYK